MSQILPSLLEYSPKEIRRKCLFINKNLSQILIQTHQKNLSLHLDFVLPQFAKDRSVMASLHPQKVFEVLYEIFQHQPLNLTIHLMGEAEDMLEVFDFFSSIQLPTWWNSLIFVDQKYHHFWSNLMQPFPQVQVGVWFDIHQWKNVVFQPFGQYLLMTVAAGKSGKKRQDIDRQEVIQIARQNPQSFFIFDGGWSIEESVHVLNTSLVSYSSFWQKIGYNSFYS